MGKWADPFVAWDLVPPAVGTGQVTQARGVAGPGDLLSHCLAPFFVGGLTESALSHSGASSWGCRGPKSGRPGSEGREGTSHSHRGGLLPASPVLETQPAGWGPGPPPSQHSPFPPVEPVQWPPASFLPGGRGAQKGSAKARGQNTETQVGRTPGSLARRPKSSRPAPILTPSVPCFPMSYLEKQQRGNK